MAKNLYNLSDSVEEETEESKKGRRHSQETLRCYEHCQPFQFSTIAHCINCSLIHTFHHIYSPESHHSSDIFHLVLLQFLPSPKAKHHIALTWIVTLLIIPLLLTFTPFITHVLANLNTQQYASHMYLFYSLCRPSPSSPGYSLYIPILQ